MTENKVELIRRIAREVTYEILEEERLLANRCIGCVYWIGRCKRGRPNRIAWSGACADFVPVTKNDRLVNKTDTNQPCEATQAKL